MPACVLLTRPAPDNPPLAAALQAYGIRSIASPLLEVVGCDYAPPAHTPDALLLTSRHAAYACSAHPDTPLYVVGEQTANTARAHGCRNIRVVAPDMESLLPHLPAEPMYWVYYSGAQVRHDITALLPQHQVEPIVVYEALAAASLTSEAEQAMQDRLVDGVVLYSPRSAGIFHHLVPAAICAGMNAYCFSPAVAETVAAHAVWHGVKIAETPTQDAMIRLVTRGK